MSTQCLKHAWQRNMLEGEGKGRRQGGAVAKRWRKIHWSRREEEVAVRVPGV